MQPPLSIVSDVETLPPSPFPKSSPGHHNSATKPPKMSHNLEWTDSLLKVTSRDSPSATSGIHYDLSTFLSIVLKSRINILAAMWNAMSSFSHGGTANIRQWIVNVETTLAFKRTSRLFIEHPTWVAYKALISEVLILGSPAVHGHPNIVNLEAVSWEIVDGGDIRPVLVFEKAQRQDMGAFLKSEEGCEISFDARVSLCKHVAHGLMLLHRSSSYAKLRLKRR